MAGKVCLMKRAGAQEKMVETVYDDFMLSRKAQNLREATIKYYYWHLKPFKEFVLSLEKSDIGRFKKGDFDKYVLWLMEKHKNAVTINSYLRACRAFLNYAMELGYLEKFAMKLIRQEKAVKEVYSHEEIKTLVKKPDLKNCSFTEYRNWVMVQYFLETGNRLSTVTNIKVSDVCFNSGLVTLTTNKNRKVTYSPVGNSLLKILRDYLSEWALTPNDYLFPNVERKQLTKDAIQNSIAKYNHSRGVEKTSIHCFRHTFAKNYVMKGGNAFKLQLLLSHSSIEVTRQYVNLFGTDLAEDFDRFSIIDEFCHRNKVKRN